MGSSSCVFFGLLPKSDSEPREWFELIIVNSICRRVVRPWLGLKMLDLNDMIVAQLKEKDVLFPDVTKGVLVPMVRFFLLSYHFHSNHSNSTTVVMEVKCV